MTNSAKLVILGIVCLAVAGVFFFHFSKRNNLAAAGGTQYILTSGQDYTHYTVGPLGCPDCKDGFYSTKPIQSPPGTKIASITVVARTPTSNNHWYRCQVEVPCGFEEFSDVTDYKKSCVGTAACLVWRATDGSTRMEQDTINVTWQ